MAKHLVLQGASPSHTGSPCSLEPCWARGAKHRWRHPFCSHHWNGSKEDGCRTLQWSFLQNVELCTLFYLCHCLYQNTLNTFFPKKEKIIKVFVLQYKTYLLCFHLTQVLFITHTWHVQWNKSPWICGFPPFGSKIIPGLKRWILIFLLILFKCMLLLYPYTHWGGENKEGGEMESFLKKQHQGL